ncbi:PP2C family protein-serine/threonine phosphatase [Argonema galeatum]|uniref:PP2C family protein-serine/threonine phosphatase n=1 Tax=Argonema galeatum TaxID=2942762 RepID=UPI002013BA8F|nr:protein phosphatase 2C domain-containing protein [Argonema galeatum]MCL1464127.1 protein phosphatase 2C domain-containing protein [Argonema galeatum A003/A1]
MKSRCTGLSDPGLVRPVNQDAFYIDPDGRFFIVADGMGGHAGGEEASWIATDAIKSYLNEYWDSQEESPVLVEAAFWKANQAIVQDQREHPERSDMGTTAVVVLFRKEQALVAHVGDSRLYRLRAEKLEKITEDHTWVARALKSGVLSPSQARVHPWRHMLSQCVGREDLGQVEIQSLDVEVGDRLLLCSDGLTEELSDLAIASYLQSPLCETAAMDLIEAAKEQGGRDNITTIVVAIE